ncbi:hypothetical protein NYP18_01915 [Corynebacterium sp. YIM 101645]|uniref:Uncharacterized protein n=1 Tax=Corynebacterium lemuris TaxID=1859292 RepID=A0ABT2FT53_9CORY|nr:hypothetical protein [Corynebacterium lemuris]MCS5478405.1 hypothetical protein [Corynebacterium lemuris]
MATRKRIRNPYPAVQTITGQLSAARRWHPDNTEAIAELERTAAAARIATFAAKVMAGAPALTPEHVDKLTALVTKGGEA